MAKAILILALIITNCYCQDFQQLVQNYIAGLLGQANVVINPEISAQFIIYYYFTLNGNDLVLNRLDPNQNLSLINPEYETKFLVHGWSESIPASPWWSDMARNYLTRGQYNVIGVDWSRYSQVDYFESVYSVAGVGTILADFINRLRISIGLRMSRIHIIGFSLGAHVSGYAGQQIQVLANEKLNRITGLDAAGPLFEYPILVPRNKRLTADDAIFVDGLHTSGTTFGFLRAYATIDFYINGGIVQPGCPEMSNSLDLTELETDLIFCNHVRCPRIWVFALASDDFLSRRCYVNSTDREIMGEDVSKNFTGKFCLRTSAAAPYALGQAGL